MDGRIRVYQPDVRIVLYKTISRTTLDGNNPVSQRFQGLARTIDLTPFLADGSSVRTSKSVREPAGGFMLTLADKPYKGSYIEESTFESLYGLIEPMDFIEIRMRHDPPALGGAKPPVIMRGFVSAVSRTETMGADGRPQRAVLVRGLDYGKLWQQIRLMYTPGYIIGQNVLSGFKLFELFGVGFQNTMPAADFVTQVVEKILNPYLANLMPKNTSNPSTVQLDVRVKHGTIGGSAPQNFQGTLADMLRAYGDVGVWNELYLDDREDGVYCVYRPNPALDINGNLIQSDAPKPVYVDLPDTDVISLNVERSDEGVSNYYWVRAPLFEMVGDLPRKLWALDSADMATVDLSEYENSAANLYGLKLVDTETQQGGDDVSTFSSGLPSADQSKRDTSMANWINDRREILVNQNKDNVLLERGTMRVRGNEGIKAGMYVRLRRGQFRATYYVTQVDHEYLPFVGFFSTLTVERGTGFVERSKRGGGPDSPYLAEMMSTPTTIGSTN